MGQGYRLKRGSRRVAVYTFVPSAPSAEQAANPLEYDVDANDGAYERPTGNKRANSITEQKKQLEKGRKASRA